jgi:hypothetical protein
MQAFLRFILVLNMTANPFLRAALLIALVAGGTASCRWDKPENTLLKSLIEEQIDKAAGTGSCTTSAGGVFTTIVKAISQKEWTHCNMDLGITTTATGFWDLRFRRYQVGTNSGASGSGNGGACSTGLTDLNAVTSLGQFTSPTAGVCPNFVADTIQTSQDGGSSSSTFPGSPVMLEWYSYNVTTHVLRSKGIVYLIRQQNGTDIIAIQFTDYYSDAGTSGYPTFRWKRL